MLYLGGMLKKAAVDHFGSQSALARALGITKGAVHLWGKVIPEGRAYQIESVTKRALRVDPQLYAKTTVRSRSDISAHSS